MKTPYLRINHRGMPRAYDLYVELRDNLSGIDTNWSDEQASLLGELYGEFVKTQDELFETQLELEHLQKKEDDNGNGNS